MHNSTWEDENGCSYLRAALSPNHDIQSSRVSWDGVAGKDFGHYIYSFFIANAPVCDMVQYFLIKELNPFFPWLFSSALMFTTLGVTLAQSDERTVESSQTDHINQQMTETNSMKEQTKLN